MSQLQDFTQHGYQILAQLGHNSLGGRVTYKARHLETGQFAAIKQFQFATSKSSWTDYESLEREIEMLGSLSHPGIPRYLDSFPTDNGFCLVQEYLDARSLATPRRWTLEQIKEVAVALLDVLVYLQSQKPAVIHRDIKPENILIDDRDRVYLIDFGFARTGGGEIAASSVVKGTMGFMPPEQLFDRQLTEASDLYGLGGTLICLLTGTKSVNIGNLIDEDYRVRFRHLVPPVKRGWLSWLEKLVEPKMSDRYANAAVALAVLETIDVEALPKVRIDRPQQHLEFTAAQYGATVTRNITVSNPIPKTLLSGRWEVAPHPNDSPDLPWISFEPVKFERNSIVCPISVDTRPLLADCYYERKVLLRTNAAPEIYPFTLAIHTAPLPKPQLFDRFSFGRAIYLLVFAAMGWVLSSGFHSQDFEPLLWLLIPSVVAFLATERTEGHSGPNKPKNGLGISIVFSFLGALSFGAIASQIFASKWLWILGAQFGCIAGALVCAYRSSNRSTLSKTPRQPVTNNIKSCQGVFGYIGSCVLGVIVTGIISLLGGLGLMLAFRLFGYALFGITGIGIYWFVNYVIAGLIWSAIGLLVVLGNPNLARPQLLAGNLQKEATRISLAAAGFGLSLGVAVRLLFGIWVPSSAGEPLNLWLVVPVALTSLVATGFPLLETTIFKPIRIIDRYRRVKKQLVQP
ncbi:MAG: serine/threonine-protein kinase [Cyanobacteriota bacterium]|nr:serine/threonine-protein kinase [Cyanobacteriota bacterium]